MQGFLVYGVALLAVICYGILHMLAKKMQLSVAPFTFIALTMGTLAILALCASLLYEKRALFDTLKTPQVGILFIYGLINFAGFVLYLKAISIMPIAHYQLIVAGLGPLIAAALGFVFLGKNWHSISSFLCQSFC